MTTPEGDRPADESRTAVDVAPADRSWRTSMHSANDGNCVEVRFAAESVEIRDSKDRQGPTLSFSPDSFRTFLRSTASR